MPARGDGLGIHAERVEDPAHDLDVTLGLRQVLRPLLLQVRVPGAQDGLPVDLDASQLGLQGLVQQILDLLRLRLRRFVAFSWSSSRPSRTATSIPRGTRFASCNGRARVDSNGANRTRSQLMKSDRTRPNEETQARTDPARRHDVPDHARIPASRQHRWPRQSSRPRRRTRRPPTSRASRRTAPARSLTTNQGVRVNDNQNTLKAGERGPSLLEDFLFREKITHFDHERIPERVVHARGAGAHGYFQVYETMARYTKAAFLQDPASARRSSCASRPSPARAARPTWRATCAASPSSSTRRKASSTWSATTSRSSSSRTRSSSPT